MFLVENAFTGIIFDLASFLNTHLSVLFLVESRMTLLMFSSQDQHVHRLPLCPNTTLDLKLRGSKDDMRFNKAGISERQIGYFIFYSYVRRFDSSHPMSNTITQ